MQPQLNLNPNDLENVKCDNCDSEQFISAYYIKKISALVSPNGREAFVPLQTFACSLCGHVNERFKNEIP